MKTFLAWLSGRPSERHRPGWWRCTVRVLVAFALAYFFLYGPGLRVWSSPPGFEKLTEGEISVFFQPGMRVEASAVAASALEAQRDILEFWSRGAEDGFDFPVDVYLCQSPRRYWHLVMNRAKGSASGNDLMIHASYPEVERTPYMRHELAHLFVVHELGWLKTRRYTPAWLDEGIATTLQGSLWNDRDGLAYFAFRTHELASLSSTANVMRWLGAVAGGGDRAGAQYSYARAFTEDLIDGFGRAAVLEYLKEATLTGNHPGAFARAFGVPLEQAELQWLKEATARGILPSDLAVVDRGLPVGLLIKLLVLAVLLVWVALWSVRQFARIVRFAARMTEHNPGERPLR